MTSVFLTGVFTWILPIIIVIALVILFNKMKNTR